MAANLLVACIIINLVSLLICVLPTYSLFIDLKSDELPSCVEVYGGTFSDGGVYRLILSRTPPIIGVTYGNRWLRPVSSGSAVTRDMFIQEYRRGDTKIIGVSHFTGKNYDYLYTAYYKYRPDILELITREAKSKFLNGPLFLPVDITSERLHPFILKTTLYEPVVSITWAPLPRSPNYNPRDIFARVRRRNEVIQLSPIFNIDPQISDSSSNAYLNAHCEQLLIVPGIHSITIVVRKEIGTAKHSIRIPPIVNDVFRPSNIVVGEYRFCETRNYFYQSLFSIVTIDVARPDASVKGVVILANLKRGVWLYTQHSVLPVQDQIYTHVRVINSHANLELFQVDDDAFVTHVEVFDNLRSGVQYVVINYEKLHEYDSLKLHKIYVRQIAEQGITYVDPRSIYPLPYMEMLHNINVEETITPDNGSSDSLLDLPLPLSTLEEMVDDVGYN
ncbi:uncharacterized protein BXIN_0195 [Babesia sp. Xinjiang]|uniref:uncharacterized protein n=1 Tax=Babesia sp. Xinjiang TaxID=462227 RepID=UPI000A22ED55|nr:uncharacterized protein BXIN_0195 [Babesia sp. Xinjiang]ORM39837.1 hypothetical protein BXIN_0195 [Babesia sp. Xinjiang]